MTPESPATTKPINQLVNHALELCEQFNARTDAERLQPLAEAKRILFTRIPAEPGFAEFKSKQSEFYATYVSLCQYQQRQESAMLEERFQKLRPAKPTTPPERNSSLGARVAGPRPLPTVPAKQLPYPTSPTHARASSADASGAANGAAHGAAAAAPRTGNGGAGSATAGSAAADNSTAGSAAADGAAASTGQTGPTAGRGLRLPKLNARSSAQQNGYPKDAPSLRMPEPRRAASPVKSVRAEDYEVSPAILRNKIAVSKVLVLDVRPRSAFEDRHLNAPLIACLDPTYVTSRMSVHDLDDTFVLAPPQEANNFAQRDRVDMIVLYDARSQHVADSSVLQTVANAFVGAGRRPYLLRGGIDAWVMSGNSVLFPGVELDSAKSTPPPPAKPPPPVPPPQHLRRLTDVQRRETTPLERHAHIAPQRELPAIMRMPTLPPAVPALQSPSPSPSPSASQLQSHAQSLSHAQSPPPSLRSGASSASRLSSPGHADAAGKALVHTPADLARAGYADERPKTTLPSLRVPRLHAGTSAARHASLSPSVSPSHAARASASESPGTALAAASLPPGILKTTGLKNLGNSCYMNCVIQCMLSVPSFVLPFYDGSFAQYINYRSRLGYQGELAVEFAGLVRAMLDPGARYIAPVGMKQLAGRLRPDDFGGYEQQDCQEFLTFVLDGLHEDLNSNGDKARDGELDAKEEERREQLGIRVASAIEWERYLKGDTSLIVDLFQGQYLSRLQCTVCKNTSTTYNAFSSLSLPLVSPKLLEQHATLRACFDEFVKPEVLDGDNAWHCPRCRRKQRAMKTLRISRLPPILIIHLKRFKRSASGAVNKLETPVDYPLRGLDLTRYWPQLSQGEHSQREAQLLASLPPRGQTPPFVYDLRAVTLHHGTLEGGHYTAVAQKPGRGWFYFDDANVSPVKEQAAVSKNAYVLFYTRRSSA